MPRRSAAFGDWVDQRLLTTLGDKFSPHDGFTATHLSTMILQSDRHIDVTYLQRRIGGLRYTELEQIRISKGQYKPKIFLASKKIDERFWRYFNAVREPHWSDVMKIYFQRAGGLEAVARTMEMI